MKKSVLFAAWAVAALHMWTTCSNPSTAGKGGGVEEEIVGKICNPDGTPSNGAFVQFVPSDRPPQGGQGGVNSAFTDTQGVYRINSVPFGAYNILASNNGNKSYRDSALIVESMPDTLRDTLKAPGSLSGTIHLVAGGNSENVLILVIGTDRWFAPHDSAGHFTLSDMAEGTYSVRFLCTKDAYAPLTIKLRIRAGMNDTLADIIHLGYSGVPVPTGFKAEYDTLSGYVNFSWDYIDTSLIDGYIFYENDTGSHTPETISPDIIPNTSTACAFKIFRDSIASDDNGWHVVPDTNTQVYDIRMKSLGKNKDPSLYYSTPVRVYAISPHKMRTLATFSLLINERKKPQVGDSVWCVVQYSNYYKTNTRVLWYSDSVLIKHDLGQDPPLYQEILNNNTGTVRLTFLAAKTGRRYLSAIFVTEAQRAFAHYRGFTVMPRLAIAGPESIKVGSPVTFSARPDTLFSPAAMYAWDKGQGAWGDSSKTQDSATITYEQRDTITIRLYRRDVDGYEDTATATVKVYNDNPVIAGLNDTVISITDSVVTFNVGATDQQGVRQPYYWDFDGDGIYEDTAFGGTITHTFPGTPHIHMVAVGIRDNYDGFGTALAKVALLFDPPVATAACSRTAAFTGQTIAFFGTGTDALSSVVEYAWDFNGDAVFERVFESAKAIDTSFAETGIKTVVFRVQDDDANYAYDTLSLHILQYDSALANDGDVVVCWRFDEGQGDTAWDASAHGNNGVIHGATWTDGQFGKALYFDGATAYVNIGKPDIPAPWTASFWVKREDAEGSTAILLSSDDFALMLEQYNGTNKVGFTKFRSGDYSFDYYAPVGQWVNLIFVGNNDSTKLYANGVRIGSAAQPISCPLNIFSRPDYPMKGVIDEVQIWNRAMEASEVEIYYNNR